MIRNVISLALVVSILAIAPAAEGCTPAQQEEVKTAKNVARTFLNDGEKACLAVNMFLPNTEAAKVCNTAGPLMDATDTFLAGAKAGVSAQIAIASATEAATAAREAVDAGASDAGCSTGK